jgi:VWFA-related protein
MPFRRVISPALALAVAAAAYGRHQQQPPPPQIPRDSAPQDEVVRVTTNLVQIDVVVTDKSGRQITDLGPEDFEVSEEGKRVPITNFSYVNAAAAAAESAPPAAPPGQSGAQQRAAGGPVAPAALRRDQVRRTVALVVDDLGLSFESMGYVRDALRKFVDEQMQPTDMVAVFRTSAGVGALQQFTSDKRLLHAAIERVRWYPQGRGGVGRHAAFNEVAMGADARDPVQFTQEAEESRAGLYSVGTFGSASAVVRGLADMPGRKSVVLISGVDGAAAQTGPQAGPAIRRLRQGQLLDYRYYIHNARVGPDGRPQLQTQMRLFRDSQPVFTGKLLPYDPAKQADPKRLGAAGRVRIGPELKPGQYLLQVTVTDALAPGGGGSATQWIDFEIAN